MYGYNVNKCETYTTSHAFGYDDGLAVGDMVADKLTGERLGVVLGLVDGYAVIETATKARLTTDASTVEYVH